ncbi:hypothetical protein ACFW93_46775 [Streptomyces canus]|uniref:hypothetical protein n=1 Tax=Streptomyces canus TaxID=58343 RepID=UPI0036C6F8F3
MRYADGGGLTAAGRQRREAVAYQWHQLWRDGGIEALVSRGPSGSRCRLSPRCLEKLAAYQSRDLCSALGGLSLLELDSARGGRARLHDVIRDLLRSRLGDGGVQRVNGALVNAVAASLSLADPATFSRPWFGWGDALFAELLLDLTGRSRAALHPRLSTTEPPSR